MGARARLAADAQLLELAVHGVALDLAEREGVAERSHGVDGDAVVARALIERVRIRVR